MDYRVYRADIRFWMIVILLSCAVGGSAGYLFFDAWWLGGQNETTGYNKIEFTDAQGSQVYIGVNEEGYLVVHYYPVVVASGEVKSTDWVFDQKAYMGYSIKELKFTQPKGDYADNIIYMSLTLHSSRYGDFTYTEYIQCYNLDANSDTQINCKTE